MATTTAKLAPHRIDLADGNILVLAHDGTLVLIALYRRRKSNDNMPHIEMAYFDDLVRRGLLPRGYHTLWGRDAGKARTLRMALDAVFTRAEYQRYAEDLCKYINGTSWGRNIP